MHTCKSLIDQDSKGHWNMSNRDNKENKSKDYLNSSKIKQRYNGF